MNTPPSAGYALIHDRSEALDNRFLLSAIAFLRSKQLQQGGAPRIARDGHKPTYMAVLEVLADTVSWSRE